MGRPWDEFTGCEKEKLQMQHRATPNTASPVPPGCTHHPKGASRARGTFPRFHTATIPTLGCGEETHPVPFSFFFIFLGIWSPEAGLVGLSPAG